MNETKAVHLVSYNYVIRNNVPAPPKSHELALSSHKLSGVRVPQPCTRSQLKIQDNGQDPYSGSFPNNGIQLGVVLATSLVLDAAGTVCGVALIF